MQCNRACVECGIAGFPLSSYPVVFPAKTLFRFSVLCPPFLLRAFTLPLLNHQRAVLPKNRKVSQSHNLSPRSSPGSFFSLSHSLSVSVCKLKETSSSSSSSSIMKKRRRRKKACKQATWRGEEEEKGGRKN